MDEKDEQLLKKYKEQVDKFKEFCLKLSPKANDAAFDDVNFYDLSLGFFIALGVVENTTCPGEYSPYADAHCLAAVCRYHFKYWTKS